jgi:hypothetical protein
METHSPPHVVSPAPHGLLGGGATHVPPKHPSLDPHTAPQPPQLFTSVSMSTQDPKQEVSPM